MDFLVYCEPLKTELNQTFHLIDEAKDYACRMSLKYIKHTFTISQNLNENCDLYIYKHGTLIGSFDPIKEKK